MKIYLIAGMTTNRVIGKNNTLPWHYPEDLQYFKRITTGHCIVMGSNTYRSIGRPLPNRRNIVLTSNPIDGMECYSSIETMMEQLKHDGVSEIFVIGGARVYEQFLGKAELLYITEIKKEYQGDTYFPVFTNDFVEISREISAELDFVVYKKK